MINYADMLSFYTKGQFSISDNDLNFLVWLDPVIPKPTQEQINAWEISYPHDIALVNCKNQAKLLIASSDWSVLSDVPLQNKTDFENYRSQLRNYIINPVENPIFPNEPQPIWSV
jgi:hypothetical protein